MSRGSVSIIGGDSFVGKKLYNYFISSGLDVCRTSHKVKKNFLHLDLLREPNKWPKIDSEFAVICAGITSTEKCRLNKDSYKINVSSTLKLINKLSSEGVFVVFLSSSQVFDGKSPNYSRDSISNPLSVYGKHKHIVEQNIKKDFSNKCILRITKILTKESAFFREIHTQLNIGKNVEAFNNYFISPVTINLTCKVIANIIKLKKEGIYQLSSSDQISYYDMARYYAKNLELNNGLVTGVNAKANDISFSCIPRYSFLEMNKEKEFFNLKQPTSETSLRSILF